MASSLPRQTFELIARGELTPQGLLVLQELLGSLGVNQVELTIQPNISVGEASDVVSSYEGITDPSDWVLKEHFFEFNSLTGLHLPSASVGTAFNRLVDNHKSPHSLVDAEPYPSPKVRRILRPLNPQEGIIVARREDIGAPAFKKRQANNGNGGLTIIENHAIQADSLAQLAAEMTPQLETLSTRERFIVLFGNTLGRQFITS